MPIAQLGACLEITLRWNIDAAFTLYGFHQKGGRIRRNRLLQGGGIAKRDTHEPWRKRAETFAVLRLGGHADNGNGSAMEITVAGNYFGLIRRHTFHGVRPLPRRLQRGLDGFRTRIHGQGAVLAGDLAETLKKWPQTVTIKSA